jgi:hypothetical protein
MRDRFYSTADLARVCGVSISTIKRWTDAGLLRCVRTPGGHRKYRVQDVAEAGRRLGLHSVDTEERPGAARVDELALLLLQGDRAALAARVATALAAGDAAAVRGTLFDLHRHGMRLADAALLLRTALQRIAAPAAGADTDAFVRRRAEALAKVTARALLEQAPAPRHAAPLALVAAAERVHDELVPHLALLVLAECRWRAVDLGRAATVDIVRGGLQAERTDLVVLIDESESGALASSLRDEIKQQGGDLVPLVAADDAAFEMLRAKAAGRERQLAAAMV